MSGCRQPLARYASASSLVAHQPVDVSLDVGSEPKSCTVDDDLSNPYVAEADVALWRYGAEPETGSARALVDFTGPAHPDGHLAEDVDGLTVAAYADGTGYLLAGNESASVVNVYRRDGTNEYVGSVAVASSTSGSVDGVDEPGGVAVLPVPVGNSVGRCRGRDGTGVTAHLLRAPANARPVRHLVSGHGPGASPDEHRLV